MKYYYDVHIHSVLSPCADVLMTPNNIFNMAMLKKLDIIAVTDHNSLKQVSICNQISKSYDMLYIPAVEITVSEGFDVLVYFKSLNEALAFDQIIESHLSKIEVDLNKYNEQTICDIYDEKKEVFPFLLAQPIDMSIVKILDILKGYDHLIFYAHVDRYIDKVKPWILRYPCHGVEYKSEIIFSKLMQIHNSDAHQIIDILERSEKNAIELDELSIDAFFKYFSHG